MSNFFKTKEYKFLNKIKAYLMLLNTKRNYGIYRTHLGVCKTLARDKFNNIGWSDERERYNWDTVSESDLPEIMTSLGDYEDGLSFYPGHILYMSEGFTSMALKLPCGKVVQYTTEETKAIKHMTIKELQIMHELKVTYEGRVVK